MQFLKNRFALLLSLLLACQAVGAYLIDKRAENSPTIPALSTFPASFSGWNLLKDYPMEEEVQKVLQATDTITRARSRLLPGTKAASSPKTRATLCQ